MPKKLSTIVGIGEVLWDIFADQKRLGGAPANFTFHCRQLGGNACLASQTGNDPLGHELHQILNSKGINRDFIPTHPSLPTGTVHVHVSESGSPEYTIEPNVAWDFLPWSSQLQTLAGHTDAVCFGSLAQRNACSRETIRNFLSHTPSHCLKIFDINLRLPFPSMDIILASLEMATLFKLNDEELAYLAPKLNLHGNQTELLTQLKQTFNLDGVALTRGAHGSILLYHDALSVCPGIPASITDTVGAGDAFTAALCIGILKCLPVDTINELACRVGSYICTQSGAMARLPDDLIAGFHPEPQRLNTHTNPNVSTMTPK